MKKLVAISLVSMALGGVMGAMTSSALAEPQPAMRQALALMEQARGKLEAATPDKGGHRAKALVHLQRAIDETRQGVAADNRR